MSLCPWFPLRSGFVLGLLLIACGLHAQNAFNDSLSQVAERLRDRAVQNQKLRVAVVDVLAPAGDLSPAMLTYIEETLIARLVQAGGVSVLERRQLGVVQDEQRRSANGTFDEREATELGKLLAADAIITGRVFQVDKRMHLMLRLLDTSTGVLLGSVETFTAFPKGKDVNGREEKVEETVQNTQQPVRMKRSSNGNTGSHRNSIVEMRAMGLGASYYGGFRPGAALEIAVRAREQNQDVAVPGRVAVGLQLGFFPAMVDMQEVPFDIGHIADLQNTEGFNGFPSAQFGNTNMGPGRLFLMSREPAALSILTVTGPNVVGTEVLEYDRYRLSNVRMDMAGFNVPLRWYLGENHIYDNVLKVYTEVGFGMDVVRTVANYEVTNTLFRLNRGNYLYDLQVDQFSDTEPSLSSAGSNMWFTHFSFGGGVEIGRFNLFGLGRWNISTTFTERGSSLERVRGNVLAYPLLVGVGNDAGVLRELERDGAVPFGATDLERIGSETSGGSSTGATVTGNGVDRFWQGRHFIFGLSFRFL